MHLPFLASITHQITTRLSIYWKIVVAKDTVSDGWRGMAQTTISSLIRHLGRTQNLFACGKLERIKTSLNLAVVKDFLRFPILNKKMPRMKLKKYMIIIGETMNRNKIFVSSKKTWSMFFNIRSCDGVCKVEFPMCWISVPEPLTVCT
jgi:hypothetical protein